MRTRSLSPMTITSRRCGVRVLSRCLAAAVLVLFSSAPAHAQPFPSKAFTIYVTTSPGGPNDTMARIWAEQLHKKSGQSVVVENRPGATGSLAMSALLAAPADGHAVAVGGPQVQSLLVKDIGYDPSMLTPVSILADSPFLVVASRKSNLKNYNELLAYAKSKPESLTLGMVTGVHELITRAFELAIGAQATRVPYKGGAPLEVALASGEIDAAVFASLRAVKAGQVVPILTAGDARNPEMPGVPTFKELAIDYDPRARFAVWARRDTPADLLDRLSRECQDLVRQPEFAEAVTQKLALRGVGSTRAQALKTLTEEYEQMKAVADRAGIRPR